MNTISAFIVSVAVAPHGLTDFCTVPPWLLYPTYGVMFGLTSCLPMSFVWGLAALASWAHFSADIGSESSLLLISFTTYLYFFYGLGPSVNLLVVYMLAVHLPLHYRRVCPAVSFVAWTAIAAASVVFAKADVLTHLLRKEKARRVAAACIIAHTLLNNQS